MDGRLTAALGTDEKYTVHGLDTNPENVGTARRHIVDAGLCGRVSVERLIGAELPYADKLVNLAVAGEH